MSECPTNNLTLCYQCQKHYPLLYLNNENKKEVKIKCEQCGYNQYTSIHDYLNRLQTTSFVKNEDDR